MGMKRSRTQNAKRNILSGFTYKCIILIGPFITRTAIIRILGEDYLGLNSFCTSILQVLSLAELGFGGAIVFSLYEPIAKGDADKIWALLAYFRQVYRRIGIAITLLGLAAVPFLEMLIEGEPPADVSVQFVYVVFLFNTAISYFMYAYKSAVLIAHQRSDIENSISAVVMAIGYVAQVVALAYLTDYYLYLMVLPLMTIAINILRAIVVRRQYPELEPNGTITKDERADLRRLVLSLLGHKIGGIVVGSVDTVVISAFLGLSAVAVYTNYYFVMTGVVGLTSVFYSSITAGLGNSVVTETREKNYNDFRRLLLLNAILVIILGTTLVCLYQPFMYLWVGPSLMLDSSYVFLFGLYFFITLIRYITLTYKDACGLWAPDVLKPYIEAALNLGLNILLIQHIGLYGVLISTIISLALVALPVGGICTT